MCSNNCKHRIELLNLSNNEVVNHRYLLIKGLVRCNQLKVDPSKQITISLDHKQCPPLNQYLTTQVSPINGQFKCLVDLEGPSGERSLAVAYDEMKLHLIVMYTPRCTPYKVQPLLILAKDEVPLDSEMNRKIIQLNLSLIQSIYADKLREAGKGRCTFELLPECQIFQSRLTCNDI